MSERIYPSKYSPDGLASAACWLAEMVCENIATKKKLTLKKQFYCEDAWKKEYALQINHANALIKVFDLKAIGNAIRRKNVRYRLLSLGVKWFYEICKEEHKKLMTDKVVAVDKKQMSEPEEAPVITNTTRPAFKTKKSKLDTLKEI